MLRSHYSLSADAAPLATTGSHIIRSKFVRAALSLHPYITYFAHTDTSTEGIASSSPLGHCHHHEHGLSVALKTYYYYYYLSQQSHSIVTLDPLPLQEIKDTFGV